MPNMTSSAGVKKIILVAGDIAAFVSALLVSIAIRYPGNTFERDILQIHFAPFGALFLLWLLVFYIYNLYDLRYLENTVAFFNIALQAFILNSLLAIAFFYFNPYVSITPRTVLFVDILFSAVCFAAWRMLFNRSLSQKMLSNIALASVSPSMQALAMQLVKKPALGYRVSCFISSASVPLSAELSQIPIMPIAALTRDFSERPNGAINMIVVEKLLVDSRTHAQTLFSLLPRRVSFRTLPSFIEHVFQKVPLSEVTESWFLENLSEGEKRLYENFKRTLEAFLAVLLGILLSPLMAMVALGIKLEDGRNVFYRQVRLGKSGKIFRLLKFQSMVENAESGGPQWTKTNDPRVTRFGTFLRSTRLDELPQLWNVFTGDLSFIGPRPERPEFVEKLDQDIPFYGLRNLVRPGLSGWAQINKPLHSVEDSYEKLEYDLFYIKNRSFALDLAITLKTLSIILMRRGR